MNAREADDGLYLVDKGQLADYFCNFSTFKNNKYTLDIERDNFCRLGIAIVGTGTRILQDILESFIPSANICMIVNNHHQVWRRLDQYQKTLITRAPTDGYVEFDITLTYVLLRNVCTNLGNPATPNLVAPNAGWGRDPNPADCNISDDIERIRILRNKMYGHLSRASISCLEYRDIWQRLMVISTRMKARLNKDYPSELHKTDSYKVSGIEMKELIQLIADRKEHDKILEDHQKRIDALEIKQQNLQDASEEQKDQLEVHSERLNFQSTRMDVYEKRIRSHDVLLQAHSEAIGIQEDTIKINQERIQDHESKIERNTSQLQSHDFQMEESKTQMQRQRFAIDFHEATLECHDLQLKLQDSQLGQQQTDIENIRRRMKRHQSKDTTVTEDDVRRLAEVLYDINNHHVQRVPMAPLQMGRRLPLELLYASVSIVEDNQFTCSDYEKIEINRNLQKNVEKPEDIFNKNNKKANTIYMLGKAAHGKTVYCLRFLQHWCNSRTNSKISDPWTKYLGSFDFVFLIQLRHVNKSRTTLEDMICFDVLKGKESRDMICHILSCKTYKCLIIIDGLDEWKPNKEAFEQLICKGMPNYENLTNCVLFITTRPWKFEMLADILSSGDQVVEIHGLGKTGIAEVTRNVLANYYGLKEKELFERKYAEIMRKANDVRFHAFMQIPLLAVVCIQMWYEGKQVGKNLTSFYIALLELMIKRLFKKEQTDSEVEISQCSDSLKEDFPTISQKNENLLAFIPILSKIGSVAYSGLFEEGKNLIFKKDVLQNILGMNDLQFALDVGLLSHSEAGGSVFEENVNVSFFHKSIQEFLAAIYAVCERISIKSVCKKQLDLRAIGELSNVISFICGLNPLFGCEISKLVSNSASLDLQICKYRHSQRNNRCNTSEILQKLQLSWYMEFKYGFEVLSNIEGCKKDMEFHVSDICLFRHSDMDTIKGAEDVLMDDNVTIGSLQLCWVPVNDTDGISNNTLNRFLQLNRTMVALYINGAGTSIYRSIHRINVPSLEVLSLFRVVVYDTNHSTCPSDAPLLVNTPNLKCLELRGIKFFERPLRLISEMPKLEKIELEDIQMTKGNWKLLVISLVEMQSKFEVKIIDTDIDTTSKEIIRNCPLFKIKMDTGSKLTFCKS